MKKIITATSLMDINLFCKKGEVVTINVQNKTTLVPRQVSGLCGTETVMIPIHQGFSITNSNGDTYSDNQLTGIVGYRTSMNELFKTEKVEIK